MDNGGWYNAFNMREVLKSIGNRLDQRLSRNAANRERKLQRKQDQNAMHEREIKFWLSLIELYFRVKGATK
jgi:hypothetical protein